MVWPVRPDLHGLVDLGFSVRTRRGSGPVLPDARAAVVRLGDGTVRVCGPRTRPWAPRRAGVDIVGLALALGAVPAVLGVPAHVLTDRRVHLHDLWGSAATELVERTAGAPDEGARAALLQQAVLARGADASGVDPSVRHLVRRLGGTDAGVRAIAGEVGLSERQLRRRCEVAVGVPPSVLRRLLRLHRFLDSARTASAQTSLTDLASGAGYADQAHLSRETRALTGRSPSQCLARSAGRPIRSRPRPQGLPSVPGSAVGGAGEWTWTHLTRP